MATGLPQLAKGKDMVSMYSPDISPDMSPQKDHTPNITMVNSPGQFSEESIETVDITNIVFPPTPENSPGKTVPVNSESELVDSLSTSPIKSQAAANSDYNLTSLLSGSVSISTVSKKSLQTSEAPPATYVEGSEELLALNNDALAVKKKKSCGKALRFPPCFVCSGKASGLHYGVNSCEACKGFFRRYLLRSENYKCTKGGNCAIINRNRGNCSSCRLQKCLAVGMAKEKSKLGRYTLSKRTETIKEVNKLDGKQQTEMKSEDMEQLLPTGGSKTASSFNPHDEMISRKLSMISADLVPEQTFSDTLVDNLVIAMKDIKPYGPDINTVEDIQNLLKLHYERYLLKVKLYGPMKTIPKEEHYKLYKDFGIDVDDRMHILKESVKDIEGLIERYCNFAKQIPGFIKLSIRDQSNLLKSTRADFFFILMHKGYSEEYQVFVASTGDAYHIEECADKFFSRELVTILGKMYTRWQMLDLTEQEIAILIALTLFFTDRCTLDSYRMVEKIQFSLIELLRNELEKTCKATAQRKFVKIISNLTQMREVTELYLKEYQQICKDKVVVEEVPMLTEFLLEDC